MIVLISGLALWCGAHLFKRAAPVARARLGTGGKAVVAVALIVSVVLMVYGYKSTEGAVFWTRSPALVGINNLLMLVGLYLYAVGGPRGPRVWIGTRLRHPQLVGFSIWAIAHLVVNGDTPSFVLFGGLLIWAIAEMLLINAQEGAWTPPPRAPRRNEGIYIVASLAIMILVMFVHNWLGVQPWG